MDRVKEYATRGLKAVVTPFQDLWNSDSIPKQIAAIAIPVVAGLGIAFGTGYGISGLSLKEYTSLLTSAPGKAFEGFGLLKDRAMREIAPWFAVVYVAQGPNGWSLADTQSVSSLLSASGKTLGGWALTTHLTPDKLPIAHFQWLADMQKMGGSGLNEYWHSFFL